MKKKTAIIIISYFCAAIAAMGAFTWIQNARAEQYKRAVDASYQHAFAELVTSMTEIDSALQKSLYATSPSMAGAICTELFGKAMTAQMSLGVLPFSTQELEQTAGFISRVGDYAFCLSRAAARGEQYTDACKENLRALSETATLLSQNLTQLQLDMSDGYLTMDELNASQQRMDNVEDADTELSGSATVGGSMRLIEQEFPEVPSLIYDGPFSEHITDMSPKMLENEETVSEEDGRKAAAEFLGLDQEKLVLTGQSEGDVPAYYYTAKIEGGVLSVEVSAQGGHVINLLSSRQPGTSSMSAKDALSVAKRFLERRGFPDMKESYYMIQNNILTANFAYVQDGVVCYSDLVKVAVALDTGLICGFEAKGYLTAHYERELPEVEVDVDTARELVAPELTVLSEQVALIPTDGKYEILCHEFKCEAEDERHYIIYVNAVTGEQEKILILLEDENGALTL
jgi:spore germination protein